MESFPHKYGIFTLLLVIPIFLGPVCSAPLTQAEEKVFEMEVLRTINKIRSLHPRKLPKFASPPPMPEEPPGPIKPLILNTDAKFGLKNEAVIVAEQVKEKADFCIEQAQNCVSVDPSNCATRPEHCIAEALKEDYGIRDDELYGYGIGGLYAADYRHLRDLGKLKGGIAARFWYRTELPLYNFIQDKSKNIYRRETAHFSQMIWEDTEEIGVSTAETIFGDFIIVYTYKLYGNYGNNIDFFADHVNELEIQDNPPLSPWDFWEDDPDLQKFLDTPYKKFEDYW